jgi:lipopolysaccharide export system permease protein
VLISVLSRYVARLLLARVLILLAGLAALMLVLEFLADGDKVIEASDGVVLPVLRFTLLRLPEILAELLPVTAMLAALLTFADLSRHSELTAIHAAGISKPRLAVAVLPVALLIALGQFVIADQGVPRAAGELRAWGIGDYEADEDAPPISWLRQGDDILRIGGFDAGAGALSDVTIFERDAAGNLIAVTAAPRAAHRDGRWLLEDASRSVLASGEIEHHDRLVWAGELAPALLAAAIAHPRETPLRQLLAVVRSPGLGTQPGYRYMLWLQERLAAPPTTIAMLLIIVALMRPTEGRAAQGWLLVLGVAIGFVCWTFDGLVLTLGELGLLPPALAAWTPLAVFAVVAASIMLQQERGRRARGRPALLTAPKASGA